MEALWWNDRPVLEIPPLDRDIEADICVVGAGISGLSVAYGLAKEWKSVVVVDDGPVGRGETGLTSAHLAAALDDRYVNLERLHGEAGSRLAAESHVRAIDWIEEVARDEKIDCDFERVDGYLYLAKDGDLRRELAAARRAGLDVEMRDRAPVGSFDSGECILFRDQAQFHPLKYLHGLARAITARGGKIFSHAHVTTVSDEGYVKTALGFRVRAESIVVATNTPVNDRVAIHVKQAAYRTYAIAAPISSADFPRILLWDTTDPEKYAPYHYVRVHGVGEYPLLIVGGEDHKTGQPGAKDCFGNLESWARRIFPRMGEVRYRWSGQVLEPADRLAFIGKNPGDERIHIVTGDSGHGLTHGTIAGILIPDLILGRPNPWTKLYDPSRRRARALKEYTYENANAAFQYRDWVKPGEAREIAEIPPGSGAVVRRGAHLIAVHRDENGVVHERSAVCPHLKAVVSWNATEKTWDCPAHGSRFTAEGKVINGPAVGDLSSVQRAPEEPLSDEERPFF